MRTLYRTVTAVALLLLAVFSMPAFALAASADQPPGPVVTGANLIDVTIGLAVPLAGYLLNHFAPWASEQAKGLVMTFLSAAGGSAHMLIGSGDFGFNQETLIAILTVAGTAVGAHLGYKAGGLNVALGAGSNADGKPVTTRVLVR